MNATIVGILMITIVPIVTLDTPNFVTVQVVKVILITRNYPKIIFWPHQNSQIVRKLYMEERFKKHIRKNFHIIIIICTLEYVCSYCNFAWKYT